MLQLTEAEQAWLDAYRKALEQKHPGAIHELLIYGSKARGQARPESDLDVLLIAKNEAEGVIGVTHEKIVKCTSPRNQV